EASRGRRGESRFPARAISPLRRWNQAFEMKNSALPVVAVQPEVLPCNRPRLFLALAQMDFPERTETRGKVRKQFGQDLALVAARPYHTRDQDPFLFFVEGFQSSRISSVKRLRSFIPAAPSSVRIALAVRPWRPMTFPKSSG